MIEYKNMIEYIVYQANVINVEKDSVDVENI